MHTSDDTIYVCQNDILIKRFCYGGPCALLLIGVFVASLRLWWRTTLRVLLFQLGVYFAIRPFVRSFGFSVWCFIVRGGHPTYMGTFKYIYIIYKKNQRWMGVTERKQSRYSYPCGTDIQFENMVTNHTHMWVILWYMK